MTTTDRFKKIANNYGELFSEVFAIQGLDYAKLEKSVFETVSKLDPDFKNKTILDIGSGDGVSSEEFVKAGCKSLTGIDLNQEMLEGARIKLGESIRLINMNAVDMSTFTKNNFDIIIAGTAIHNIARSERVSFWKEILRLNPTMFVFAEKIKDMDQNKHNVDYQKEIDAIKKIYGDKHKLLEAEEEWLNHYEYDEREALTLDEITANIGNSYDISVVFEMGLYKTILAKRK